jgi:hypothetical protein
VPVTGELLHSYGTHTDVARQILRRAAEIHAGAIVLGPDRRHATVTTAVRRRAYQRPDPSRWLGRAEQVGADGRGCRRWSLGEI